MTWYTYESAVALDAQSGSLARSAAGQVFAEDDVEFATPLSVTDLAGVTRTELVANALGVIEPFRVEDHPQVVWKSGPYVIVLPSFRGMLDEATAAAAMAEAAVVAADAAAAAAQAAALAADTAASRPAEQIPFAPNGVILATNVQEAIQEAAELGGGGAAELTSYAEQVEVLEDYPTTFPPAAHTQGISTVTGLETALATITALTAALDARKQVFTVETTPTEPVPGMREGDLVFLETPPAPITYIEELLFDALSGADGANIVQAEAGWDNMVSTPTVVKPGLLGSTAAARFAATVTRNGAVDIAAATALRISFNVRFDALAAGNSIYLLRGRNVAGAVDGPGVRLSSGLAWQIVNNNVAVGASGVRVPVAGEQWHVELAFDLTAGTAQLKLWYPGVVTIAPSETLNASGVTWNVTPAQGITRVAMGLLAAAASNPSVVMDQVRISLASAAQHPVTS